MMKRKYIGVPTQEEIIQQYNELIEMTKDIITMEQILAFKQKNLDDGNYIDIEINYDSLEYYKGEPIEVIRYEYKNIMVYANIENGKVDHNPYITLYDDDGEQFADELYYDYDKEVQRCADMGNLELVENDI